jgi:hypothetical protein
MAAIGAQKIKKWHVSLPLPSIPVAEFHFKSVGFKSSHLKNRIRVRDQDGTGFQPAGMLSHVEDSKPGTSAGVGPKDINYIFSVGAPLTNLNPVMVAADLTRIEHRQIAGLDQAGIFTDGSFGGTVYGNAIIVELFQGTATDTAHHDAVHPTPTQGRHGIAGTVIVLLVRVFEGLHRFRIQIDKYKKGCGTEMAVNITVYPFVFYYRKSDFHFTGSPSHHASHCMANDSPQMD